MTGITSEQAVIDTFINDLVGHVQNGGRLHLALDFDGTVAPFQDHVEDVRVDAVALKALRAIARQPNCVVTFATGRSVDSLRRRLNNPGTLPFNIIGSDGLEWQKAGSKKITRHPYPKGGEIMMAEFNRVARQMVLKNPGLVVEEKHGSVFFNVHNIDDKRPEKIRTVMSEIRQALIDACAHPAMPVLDGLAYFQICEFNGTVVGVRAHAFDKAFGLRESKYANPDDRIVFFCDSLQHEGNDRTTAIVINDKAHYPTGTVVQVLNARTQPIEAGAPETPGIILASEEQAGRMLKTLAGALKAGPGQKVAHHPEIKP
ncbi:MAG: hypothetical protein JWO78_735 [Micavibrio sp.]|nr:hypothetical protein [Micavibrio sp.]